MRAYSRRIVATLLAALAVLACSPPAEREAETAPEAAAEIDWFDGSVEEAFDLARSAGRPVFLYWGAVWCPPCHYLKDKVFKEPEFVERSRDFVMVYLDGDTPRAQILGERFGTQGYPTVIVFSPDGTETMRMSSLVEAERYSEVLAAAMSWRPVGDVLAEVRSAGPTGVDRSALTQLATYSWGQSPLELSADERAELFRRLYTETPAELRGERASFLTQYLSARAAQQSEAQEGEEVLGADERRSLTTAVTEVLGDAELRRSRLDLVLYQVEGVVGLLQPSPGPERSALIAAWESAAHALESDERVAVDDRLTACSPLMDLAVLGDGAIEGEDGEIEYPAELVEHVRSQVAWANSQIATDSEVQTVMSTMVWLLKQAGLRAEAEDLLLQRMDEAVAPYYYKSSLASLRADEGLTEEALALYREAYEAAEGNFTRFRWGSLYLRRLMELAPADEPTIAGESQRILTELVEKPDAFSLSNHFRLGQLEDAYLEWNADGSRNATVASVRELVQGSCGAFSSDGEDSPGERCRGFLAES